MLEAIPSRAFFRLEIPIHRLARTPTIDGQIRKWELRYLLPPLVEIDDEAPFADVYAAWNDDHFLAAFDVPHRKGAVRCEPKEWWKHDGLRLCIDTRDARDIKRATRFCHFFYILPRGGGTGGQRPVINIHRMSRAKEPPPAVDVSRIKVAAQVGRTGYSLEVAIPTACLHGWDPIDHPRIGLFYKVKDTFHGSQHLTVTDELAWNVDPSTWATGVLV